MLAERPAAERRTAARHESPDAGPREDLSALRILVVMPAIPVRGMERSNLRIMEVMRRRGADVLFITERDYGESLVREVERIGCRWTPMSAVEFPHLTKSPRALWAMGRAWARAAASVRRIIRAYRPTHIHVANISYFMLAWPALAVQRTPVVFRFPQPPDFRLPPLKQRISDAIWRHLVVNGSDVLVANCDYTVRELARTGADHRRVRVIRNMFAQAEVPASDAPEAEPGRINLAFTSQVTYAKGADLAVEAALRLLDEGRAVTLYVAGEDSWRNPFADALKERVKAAGHERSIRFLGHIRDVLGLLRQCHVHLMPTRREAFPNSVLEAKHCGLPTVASAVGGVPEMVTHLDDGYVCREPTAESLYDGIRFFLDDELARERCGQAARRSMDLYSAEQIGEQWAQLYLESLRPSKSPRS
jgi:glycosyltransferase involved in cell wall biosynthesis